MPSEAQKRASKKYNDINTIVKSVKFNQVTESDIIEFINQSDEPFATLVKRLIQEEIKSLNK